ncbi:Multidrug resistance-like ATP-binding protein MdlA [Serratia symbiotica]|nr:Multidrug resistance-like ATP-binding protein MdlA [Serratia symbiotica]
MRLFVQISWYFRREWYRYLGAIILLIIIAILQLLPPKLVGIIIDSVIKKQISNNKLLFLLGIIFGTAIFVYLLRYLWRILLFGASYHLAIELRENLYHYLSCQNPTFYINHRTGDLMARATNDVDKVVFAAGEGVLTLVDSLVMGIMVLIVMSTQISWQLTFLSLIPMPIMAIAIKSYSNKLHQQFKLAQAAFSNLNDQVQESMTSIRMIKAFGLENYQSKQFSKVAKNTSKKNMNVAKIDAYFDPTIYIAIGTSNLLAISGGSWMLIHDILTVGQLTSFVMYLGLMIWPMLALAWMFNIVERGSAAYGRILNLLEETTEIKDGTLLLPNHQGILIVNIQKFYYSINKLPILNNIIFKLKPGEMLGLCGPTGSGKSTLLSLIQRQFNVDFGQISYHNIPLNKIKLDNWRSRLSVVSQIPFLFSDSIFNNISLGNPHATQEQIKKVSKLADIHEDILNLPLGYNTEVGERGVMLSGGQKQRISIARALLLNTEILILDDALSAVDGHTESKILHNLQYWRKNRTVIISAHRLSSLVKANEIIVIQHGNIVQRGSHLILVKQKGWYRDMYCYQQLQEINEIPNISKEPFINE